MHNDSFRAKDCSVLSQVIASKKKEIEGKMSVEKISRFEREQATLAHIVEEKRWELKYYEAAMKKIETNAGTKIGFKWAKLYFPELKEDLEDFINSFNEYN